MKSPRTLSIALVMLPFVAMAQSSMQPGNWEYTMQAQVEGVPIKTPAVTTEVCMQTEDVQYGVAGVEGDGKGDCSYENLKNDGGRITYDLKCSGEPPVTGRFEFTTTGDRVEGRGVVDTGGTKITQEWTGRRLGEC